ncbi:hypothetical protein DV451_000783 [Geotrichum candidum]|uniref:Major facilitator superfamily (MFS) profile domain-containing protein n=1 Tax=Geotrichum candidum TaxID=1173061 RepID=A0A9P5GAE6_GEOCN|nr:hypothetical protein DV451_000783 [Geotrichum candidum]KAF5107664.1 hypothetical protein DV453_002937 [Geotrichum candidum]
MSLVSNWAKTIRDETHFPWNHKNPNTFNEESQVQMTEEEIALERKVQSRSGMAKYWPVVASGAGLFSDGYVNNSIGSVSTILGILYPNEYADSTAISNVSSIAFVGTVVGQLVFGYVSDYHSRKIGMIVSTVVLILFTILASASWGAGGSIYGMLAALTAYRFFIGIGIGGEYPAGSVACAEASVLMGKGKRNRWFVLFTNFMIDFGFVVSAFVPLVLLWICGPTHLTPVWRLTLGLGAIPPMSLFWLRVKFEENDQFKENNMKNTRVPYWLVIKYYLPRLIVVSLIWFIYDFSAYSFGIYSSQILSRVIKNGDNLHEVFGWNVVFNLFYLPGSFLGAFAADYLGPRLTLTIGVGLQGIIGFIMAGLYEHLSAHVGAFVVVFGIFTTLGEFGPGDQIGLIASKTCATPIRGQYYGIAAAIGKIGAFVGTKSFPSIIKGFGGSTTLRGNQGPFWISSSLCFLSAILAFFFLPALTQDAVTDEDVKFRAYLEQNGFDTSLLGDVDKRAESPSVEKFEETVMEKH